MDTVRKIVDNGVSYTPRDFVNLVVDTFSASDAAFLIDEIGQHGRTRFILYGHSYSAYLLNDAVYVISPRGAKWRNVPIPVTMAEKH